VTVGVAEMTGKELEVVEVVEVKEDEEGDVVGVLDNALAVAGVVSTAERHTEKREERT
jgi:hypothetical protein